MKQVHDIAFKTSLYNHGTISKDGKPLIPQIEYKQLYERVKNGEHELLSMYKELYSFEPKQEKSLSDIIENRIL